MTNVDAASQAIFEPINELTPKGFSNLDDFSQVDNDVTFDYFKSQSPGHVLTPKKKFQG